MLSFSMLCISMLGVLLVITARSMPRFVLFEPSRFVVHHQFIVRPLTLTNEITDSIVNCLQADLVDRMMVLSHRQRIGDIRRFDRQPGSNHPLVAFQKLVSIMTHRLDVTRDAATDHTCLCAAVPQRNPDTPLRLTWLNECGQLNLLPPNTQSDQSILLDGQSLGRRRREEGDVIPSHLRDPIGTLLQPSTVGKTPVVNGTARRQHQFQVLNVRLCRCRFPRSPHLLKREFTQLDLDGRRCGVHQKPIVNHFFPGGLIFKGLSCRDRCLPNQCVPTNFTATRQPTTEFHNTLARPDRIDHWLCNTPGTIKRPSIPPSLQCMSKIQMPCTRERGFILIQREMNSIRNLRIGLGKANIHRCVINRIPFENQNRPQATLGHQRREFNQPT